MNKLKLLGLIVGTLVITKVIHKYVFSDKYWWVNLFKKGEFKIDNKVYNFKDLTIIDYCEFDIDYHVSKLSVVLTYNGKQFLYEALCDKVKKEQILNMNKKDFDKVILSKTITLMSSHEFNRWADENEWGI